MLRVNPKSWHAQLYQFSAMAWDRFCGMHVYDISYKVKHNRYQNTNLCTYLNMMLVRLPLIIAIHLVVVAFGVFALVYYPITMAGFGSYTVTLTTLVAAALTFIVLIYLSTKITIELSIFKKTVKFEKVKEDNGPSFWSLVKRRVVNAHDRVCTVVEIGHDDFS